MAQYRGRLELTWTNKSDRLLAHEDGSYEWLPPADFRIAEVRLLHDSATVGEVAGTEDRAKDNLLIRGDALDALTSLAALPEFEREYAGKVKLAYLDPPFNTQQSFLQYDDALEHSVWLTMMRDRLTQVKTLLAPEGSVWAHCDDSEQAYLKIMMDELFGRENFIASVIWHRTNAPKNTAQHLSMDHDYVVVFAQSAEVWRANLLPRTESMDAKFRNPDNDPRGPWFGADLTARNYYSKGTYSITTPSGRVIAGAGAGRYWTVSQETLRTIDADSRVWWGADGRNKPTRKIFLSEVQAGRVASSVWSPEEVGFVRNGKQEVKALLNGAEPFATPKPEALLHRAISIATNPGDIVLDCFLGSGTTAAVAHKMGRRWIGVERSAETIDTFAIPRLTKVVAGEDPGGITKDVGWQGGGGFRVLEVAPSMFDEVAGQVYLSEWATNRTLAEATAAQLRYDFSFDPPFCGRRGRSRLAVVDGLVNDAVVQLLVRALDSDEQLVLCGTAIDPDAGILLRELRPGSTVRKIPQSILQEYRQAVRWVQPALFEDAVGASEDRGTEVAGE